MSLGDDAPEIGRDALDPGGPPPRWLQLFPARRAALGLRPSAAPSLGFVLAGVVLGPGGFGALNAAALAHFDAVVSVALAALGVFVGLGIATLQGPRLITVIGPALIQATLTIAVVAGGLYLLLTRWGVPLPVDAVLFAAAIGICACASAATRPAGAREARLAARIGDLDDLPLIVLGALAVTLAAGRPVALSLPLTVGAALLVGIAGWLLFDRARGDAERGVFVAGTVLLLGGIAAYAGTSPLLSGCIAGIVWERATGAADRIIAADLGKLQHPLVGLLLVVAGASIEWSLALLWIAAPLVLLRLVGKLLGGAAAARLTGLPAGLLAAILVPPGVLGVALALNLQQVLGGAGVLLLSSVTVAAVVSELLSAVLPAEAGVTA
jgi:hypothetical protein